MFSKIQGNARGCLMFEPLWIIPAGLFMTYASLYMLQLGVSTTQLGWITSLGLVVQIFTSFISGHLTDRLGRRWALIIFDVISWSVATLIWAISQNLWYFVIAAIVNGFQKVPNTAWYCLLVEDTEPKNRSAIFSVLQLINVVGGLFAPLGGLIVAHFSLVPGVRLMYVIACISMTVMFIGRHFATHDTEIGLRKKRESTHEHYTDSLRQYGSVLQQVFKNRPLLLIFGVYIMTNFQVSLRGTYLSIYLEKALHFTDVAIAWFPAISSVAMLALLFGVLPRLKEEKAHQWMIIGFGVSVVANLILIVVPASSMGWVVLSTILAAAGTMVSMPYLEAVVANAIDDDQRANVLSILTVLILVFISPSGIIGGWTYSIDPRIPIAIIVLSHALCVWLMFRFLRAQRTLVQSGSSGLAITNT